jgi:gliding motility-associated-like protein
MLILGQGPLIYTWAGPNNFSGSGENLNNLTAGEYELSAIDQNGCLFTETYELSQPDSLIIGNLVSPLYPNGFNIGTYGGEDGIILQPEVNGGTPTYTFTWTGPNGFIETGSGARAGLITGSYMLIVTDFNACTDTATIILLEPIPIELPNGISPNGDGFNDNLQVRGLESFPSNSVQVYNRWGNLVHEEQNYSNTNPWYGLNQSGEELPGGTYFVIVELPGRDNLRGYLELRR